MSNVKPTVVLVAGSKGGVGKSLVSMAVIDWLHCAKRKSVLLIESDNSNTDVHKAYGAELDSEPSTLNLDLREGWLDLADRCDEHPDAHVVINTGARNLDTMLAYSGPVMTGIATQLKRHVVVLWVIDDQRDSVELLRRYFDEMSTAQPDQRRLHVICNEGQEEDRSFEYYHSTRTAKLVAAASGRTVVIPMLAKRATVQLYTKRKPIRVVAEGNLEDPVPFGTRIEMSEWRNLVWARLETLGLDEG